MNEKSNKSMERERERERKMMATTGVVQLIAIDEARHFNNNRIIKTHKKFRRK